MSAVGQNRYPSRICSTLGLRTCGMPCSKEPKPCLSATDPDSESGVAVGGSLLAAALARDRFAV
jgi:hypothetical protein